MRLVVAVVLLFCSVAAHAFQLSGTVIGSDGFPVAYASVYVKSTTYGVATNLKGQYFIELNAGEHVLVFQAVGYETTERTISVARNSKLDVRMRVKTNELQAVDVRAKGKDPAYAIMQKVVERRRDFAHPVQAYSCSTYVKADLEKEFMRKDTLSRTERKLDTLPDFLTREKLELYESYGLTHWRAPNRFKEVKLAVNDFYNRPNQVVSVSISTDDSPYHNQGSVNRALFKVDQAQAIFNFYESTMDLPALGMVPFMSPVSPFGLTSYKFRLDETFVQEGRLVNKIEVIPRREGGALWRGYVYVVDGSWNLKAVNLEADKGALNYFDYFKVMQEYELASDTVWMLSREEFFYNTRSGKKAELGHTLIANSDYMLEPEFARNFFRNELRVTVDSAEMRDSSYWARVRPVTLKAGEARFVQQQDSIMRYHKSEEYLAEQDSSYNHHNIWNFLITGIGWRNSFKKHEVYINPLVNTFNPFGVGGWRQQLGGSYEKEFSRATKMRVTGNINYGWTNGDLKGGARVSYLYNPRNFGRLYVEGRNNYELVNTNEALVSLLAGSNYVEDLFFELGHELEVLNGLFVDFKGEYGQKRAIDDLVQNPIFEEIDPSDGPGGFEEFDQFLLELKLTWIPGNKYYSAPFKKVNLGSKWPTVKVAYRRGIPGVLGSTANFDFLHLDVEDDVTLGTFGDSRWRAMAGTFINDEKIYFTDFKYFRGYDPVLFTNPLVNFQLLDSTRTTTKPYLQARYLHRFNGILLNKIPLLKRAKMTTVVGTGTLLMVENDFRHAEVFAGLELPFKFQKQLFRIGVYYVVADSNFSRANQQIKVGLDFFNPFTNKWSY